MTRIDELQKKYPTIHKEIIVKWEMLANRVRDSEDLDKISSWRPASQGSYRSYDAELTLERLAKETPWRVKDGATLLPSSLMMSTGVSFSLQRDPRSPYTIREVSDGKFALFEGEEMVDVDLYPTPMRKQRTGPGLVTSKGTPAGDLVACARNCYHVVPVRFCEYFNTGEECKFCNFNPTQEDARAVGLNRPVTINPDETAEAFKLLGSEVRLLEGQLESGGFARVATESSVNCRFVEAMSNALPYQTDLKLVAEAMPRKELLRLRDVGLTSIRMQMETFDERLFPKILPGKAKHLSREGWLEAFQDAVDIYGVGHVAAKEVGGVTLQGPDGYSTWEEARDSHLEGERWAISHGVFPGMQALRWAPGSPFSQDPANRTKFAPTEFFLDVILGHHAAMKEYGLYEKLNRFLYCGLCCHGVMNGGEMGILEIAGDYGAWMSKVVPDKANWIAQFLDSIKSGAGVQ